MKVGKLRNTIAAVSLAVAALSLVAVNVTAQVLVSPFYEAASKMIPEGKLGQVIKKEEIKTSIPGARAWLIVYVSSDIADHKTIATGLVVAPSQWSYDRRYRKRHRQSATPERQELRS